MLSIDEITKRLDAANKKRAAIEAEVRKAEGRMESATKALEMVEADCKARGFDPNEIDTVLLRLTQKTEEALKQYEQEVAIAQQQLAPYIRN